MQEPCLLVGIWAGVRGQSQVAWEASWGGEKKMFGLVLMKGRVEGSWAVEHLGHSCGAVRHFKPEAWGLWGMVGPCCPSVLGLLHPPQIVAGSLPLSLAFLRACALLREQQNCCLCKGNLLFGECWPLPVHFMLAAQRSMLGSSQDLY